MENTRRSFLQLTAGAALSAPLIGPDAHRRQPAVVSAHLPLGADQHHRAGSHSIRHPVVARVLEAHRGAGRDHQRRRHRGVLSEQIPAAIPRAVPQRARSLRRTDRGRASRRAGGHGADGLQSHRGEFLSGPPRLVRAHGRRQAVPCRRQVHHLHQQRLLRRVSARRPAGDHPALQTRRDHRQQLGGDGSRQHLLLRQLPAQVQGEDRTGDPAARQLGRPRVPAVDHVELRAAHRTLGVQQPHHAGRGRRRIASGPA